MALPTTLAVSQFADLFKVQDVEFVQNFMQQSTITGGGDRGYADRAPSMWKAKITTSVLTNPEAEGIMALINSRGGGLKSFLLFNYRLPYPSSDPNGLIIGSTVPTVNVIADRLHVSFANFPPGYEIPLGTYFGIVFDTSRYYLGQFAEPRTANPITGAVASVEVWPPLPASVTSGAPISIKKPPAKFTMVPNSAYPSKQGGLHSAIQFSAEQTYSR